MPRPTRLAAALLPALLLLAAAPGAAAVSPARGLYVWDATEPDVVDFAVARGRTEVYAHVPPGAAADPRLLDVVARGHAAGLSAPTLLSDVVARVDGIAVMAYRDTLDGPDGVLAHATTEVDAAAAAGIRAVLALETVDTGLDKVDFAAEGDAALGAALAGVDAAFAGHPGYAGTAVHEHRTWRSLRSEAPPLTVEQVSD